MIEVTDLAYQFTASPDTTIVTFKMTKNGAPINGGAVENVSIVFAPYTGTTFELEAWSEISLKGKLTYDPETGVTTSTLVELDPDGRRLCRLHQYQWGEWDHRPIRQG